MHDTQTTTETRTRSCQEVHGLVSWVGQERFVDINVSGLRDVSNAKAPGGGPVREERRKTVVTVQWPPEDGREDDVQTTYGPWYVVGDDCYREETRRKYQRWQQVCHLVPKFGKGWSGHVSYTQAYNEIKRHYVRPVPPQASSTRTANAGDRYETNDCYCWDEMYFNNPCPNNPYRTRGGGGGGSSDDDDDSGGSPGPIRINDFGGGHRYEVRTITRGSLTTYESRPCRGRC